MSSIEQQEKSTPRPWSVSVETEAEDGLTITIPEIGRCLHDWEWADAGEWDRDLANADLIVTAVNERDQLLNSLAEKQEEIERLRRAIEAAIPIIDLHAPMMIAAENKAKYESVLRQLRAALNPISAPQEQES